jgi:cell fate (sporulation/competence/biofilm development) regulator YlbF (YheA/YmcA/DUF963 family)
MIMATTQEILDAARALGKQIQGHDVARRLETALRALQQDVEAQRVLADYNRHLTALGEKESAGRPIEVADKRKLEELQQKVIMSPKLQQFQMAQMDYLDLMRKVDEAMTGEVEAVGAAGQGGGSPLDLGGR